MIRNTNPEYHLQKKGKSDVKKDTLIDYLRTFEGKEFIVTLNFGQEGADEKTGE
jgi:hypothetical protein